MQAPVFSYEPASYFGNSLTPKCTAASKLVTTPSTTSCRLCQRVTLGVCGLLSWSHDCIDIEPDLSRTSSTLGGTGETTVSSLSHGTLSAAVVLSVRLVRVVAVVVVVVVVVVLVVVGAELLLGSSVVAIPV